MCVYNYFYVHLYYSIMLTASHTLLNDAYIHLYSLYLLRVQCAVQCAVQYAVQCAVQYAVQCACMSRVNIHVGACVCACVYVRVNVGVCVFMNILCDIDNDLCRGGATLLHQIVT